MKRLLSISLLAISLSLTTISCKKEGPGGNTDLNIYVRHHEVLIPGAVVYIKYGQREFPGHNSENYDSQTLAGTTGSDAGYASFKGLRKGNYYLYSVGYDTTIQMAVKGGIPVSVDKKSGEVIVDLPVKEEH
jgi:hypothetical protein